MKRNSSQETVHQYFDDRAKEYQHASASWPWSWIRKIEAAAVLSLLGNVSNSRVLDFGCGAGFYSHLIMGKGASEVVAVDFSESMITQLQDGPIRGVVGDLKTVSLDQTFKRIVCAGVLEFVDAPDKVMKNARHHAVTGAVMVILVPRPNFLGRRYRQFHSAHRVNVQLFDYEILSKLVENSGWKMLDRKSTPPFSTVLSMEAV